MPRRMNDLNRKTRQIQAIAVFYINIRMVDGARLPNHAAKINFRRFKRLFLPLMRINGNPKRLRNVPRGSRMVKMPMRQKHSDRRKPLLFDFCSQSFCGVSRIYHKHLLCLLIDREITIRHYRPYCILFYTKSCHLYSPLSACRPLNVYDAFHLPYFVNQFCKLLPSFDAK